MKFTFYFFILIFLHSEESIPSEHSNIKKLIETNQLQKAKLELGLAMKGNENDPTLNFYQTGDRMPCRLLCEKRRVG